MKEIMTKANLCISIILFGSIMLVFVSCDSQPTDLKPSAPKDESNTLLQPDLSQAIEMRMAENFEGAVKELRKLNEKFPDSVEILIQLGRALVESENYALATFRFEQALSGGASKEIHLDAANAHLLAEDQKNAQANFDEYLKHFPENKSAWLSYARLLSNSGLETEAINAFSRVSELCDHNDSLKLAEMFFKKKLWAQAGRWYREAAKRESKLSPQPLLGLLKVSLIENDQDQAESLALTIEKTLPGTIDSSEVSQEVAKLLIRRRLVEFLDMGIEPDEKKVSELAAALLNKSNHSSDSVVSAGPKLPPSSDSNEVNGTIEIPLPEASDLNGSTEPLGSIGLADAFSTPAENETTLTPIEKGRSAYLDARYSDALFYARDALKSNSSDPEAWRLCSQAHFQLGEVREAEMTILEAIRHNPFDLDTRMDYLRIARETLSAQRYLLELEKSKEIFPNSSEILWELARRYHLVEKMPVTAGILYRQVLKVTPQGSALHEQAKMELLKLQSQ